jgi:hypothetical protein
LHNINGLKLNKDKLVSFLEAADNLTDIFRISKTNLSKREGQILNRILLKSLELTGFWLEKEEKIKGLGVAIILKSQ